MIDDSAKSGVASQTPGQWSSRYFVVLAMALLLASVPCVHGAWHGLLGRERALVPTRAQRNASSLDLDGVLSGRWMLAKERELRERSPMTWWLRGNWNELRYRLGAPVAPRLVFGADGWLFARSTVAPPRQRYRAAAPLRRALLLDVQRQLREAGAELVVAIVPNKVRLYADRAFGARGLPSPLADDYGMMLDELEQLGIPAVDLDTPLRAARASVAAGATAAEMFFARDTHWRPGGALAAGRATAAFLEQRFADRLPARGRATLKAPRSVRMVGDLTDQLGLLSAIVFGEDGRERPIALSLLTDALAEAREYYGVDLEVGGRSMPLHDAEPAAVALVGTSFAMENGAAALTFALGRPVWRHLERGASGLEAMRKALPLLLADGSARIVVWEIVERGFFEPAWLQPAL